MYHKSTYKKLPNTLLSPNNRCQYALDRGSKSGCSTRAAQRPTAEGRGCSLQLSGVNALNCVNVKWGVNSCCAVGNVTAFSVWIKIKPDKTPGPLVYNF